MATLPVNDRSVVDTDPPVGPSPEGDAETLSPPQRRAVLAFAAGEGLGRAAMKAGIRIDRVAAWRGLPAFRSAIETERRRIVEEAHDNLVAGLLEGLRLLRRVVADDGLSTAERAAAARALVAAAGAILGGRYPDPRGLNVENT